MEVLVLYYSRHGATEALAREIAHGIDSVPGASARIRTVPAVSANCEKTESNIPANGPPYAEIADLLECGAIALGSPTRFGNMAAPMKYFLDGTAGVWLKGQLVDKPFSVFSSSSSMHGGQESTLLTMAIPLLHHGMVWMGLPYNETDLNTTSSGGTPYGVTHVTGPDGNKPLSDEEIRLARAQGKRLAKLALCMGHDQ